MRVVARNVVRHQSQTESCEHCQINRPSRPAEPPIITEIPERPWCEISADICYYEKHSYLIVHDYYSRWIEIISSPDETSRTLTYKFSTLLARWGNPEILVSDNALDEKLYSS